MSKTVYKVAFFNQGKVYELFAEQVDSSHLYGFVEVRKLMFDQGSKLVVDPSEERMQEEFGETEALILPIQSVIRIEQVARRGECVIRDRESGEKITSLPLDGPRRRR